MKRFFLLSIVSFCAISFSLATAAIFTNPAQVEDLCELNGGHDSQDIFSLSTEFDGSNIVTTMILCGPVDPKTTYAIHYDYVAPTALYPVDCETTSDDTLTYLPRRRKPVTGPGTVGQNGAVSILMFTTPIADLGLYVNDYVLVWGRAKLKNLDDRAPDTYTGTDDDCEKPQGPQEVLALALSLDSDGDGLLDPQDNCPNVPNNGGLADYPFCAPAFTLCFDPIDQCVDVDVQFTDGTPCAQDSDCANSNNSCINAAGQIEPIATGFQCTSDLECYDPQTDTDNDGLGDACDPCPGDPSNQCPG